MQNCVETGQRGRNEDQRVTSAIEQTDTPSALLRRIRELENERREIMGRLDRLQEETHKAKALAAIKESDIRRMLDTLADDMAAIDPPASQRLLAMTDESLALNPTTRSGEIRYRMQRGVKVASPRGFEPLYSP